MADYYSVLGVKRDASADEIKQAYRRLASQHHPDRGGDTQRFQEIQQAYETLGDDTKRAAYDNPGQQMFGGGGQGNPFDFFNQMFGANFGAAFHNRRSHVRMTMWVTFVESVTGTMKTVQVGTTQGQSTVQIEVPAGIEDGDNVQYGGIAPGGMDLVIQYRVTPDPRWRREGSNIYTDHKINIWDLILGSEITIKNVQGTDLTIRVPERCQPGTLLRAKGQGIKAKDRAPGDLLIRIQAEIPREIPNQLVQAIRDWRS